MTVGFLLKINSMNSRAKKGIFSLSTKIPHLYSFTAEEHIELPTASYLSPNDHKILNARSTFQKSFCFFLLKQSKTTTLILPLQQLFFASFFLIPLYFISNFAFISFLITFNDIFQCVYFFLNNDIFLNKNKFRLTKTFEVKTGEISGPQSFHYYFHHSFPYQQERKEKSGPVRTGPSTSQDSFLVFPESF